jgi:hypothetical protein
VEPQEQQQHPQQPQTGVPQEESQDEYGEFYFNWDDPMVLAALDNANVAKPTPVMIPDPAVTMQYTHQSIVEVRLLVISQPYLSAHFESNK